MHLLHILGMNPVHSDMRNSYMHLDILLKDPQKGKLDFSASQDLELAHRTRHLGIKFCFEGTENYRALGNWHAVGAGHFLVLPPDEHFDFHCASKHPTHGMCMDIAAPMLETALGGDEFLGNHPQPYDLFGRLFHAESNVWTRRLFELSRDLARDKRNYDEVLVEASGLLWSLNLESKREKEKLPAKKQTTRDEIHKRLKRLEAYLLDAPTEAPSLENMARFCGMSPFHLLRSFKQLHGETPAQYLERIRMAKARKILQVSEIGVTELSAQLGFMDPKYFTRRFKKYFGVPPSQLH